MRKQISNANQVFNAEHIARVVAQVAEGDYYRPYIYKTPSGTFCTLEQVAAVYGITKEGARKRFSNPNCQPWIVDYAEQETTTQAFEWTVQQLLQLQTKEAA